MSSPSSIGTGSAGVGDAIRDAGSGLGPSYSAAPGKGQARSDGGSPTSSSSGNRPLAIGGYGWMNYFASPMLGCTCPKCKRPSRRPPDQRCKDTHCPYCGSLMKSSVNQGEKDEK